MYFPYIYNLPLSQEEPKVKEKMSTSSALSIATLATRHRRLNQNFINLKILQSLFKNLEMNNLFSPPERAPPDFDSQCKSGVMSELASEPKASTQMSGLYQKLRQI